MTSMRSLLLLGLAPALFGCGSSGVDADLEPWLAKARSMFDAGQTQLVARWGAPLSSEWARDPDGDEGIRFDLDSARIFWLKGDKVVLVADAQFAGSYYFLPDAPADKPNEAGSWMWSWANETVPPRAYKRIEAVRRWGQAKRSLKFTKGGWLGPFAWAQDMLIGSVRVLGALGGYFRPDGDTAYFFVLEELRKPKPDEMQLPSAARRKMPPAKGPAKNATSKD